MDRTLSIAILFGAMTGAAVAQPANDDATTTVAYPVAHLVVVTAPVRATCEHALMDHVRRMVAPKTWGPGGGELRYDEKGMILNVRQTPAVHRELAAFLKAFEKTRITVNIRIGSTPQFDEDRHLWTKRGEFECRLLNDAEFTYVMCQQIQGNVNSQMMQLPLNTVCDGEVGRHKVMDALSFVTGLETTRQKGERWLEPKAESFDIGCSATVRPTLSKDRSRVDLDLEFLYRNLDNADSPHRFTKLKDDKGDVKILTQQPKFVELKAAVSTTIPLNRTLAIRLGAPVRDVYVHDPVDLPFFGNVWTRTRIERKAVPVVLFVRPSIAEPTPEPEFRVGPLRNPFPADDRLPALPWRRE